MPSNWRSTLSLSFLDALPSSPEKSPIVVSPFLLYCKDNPCFNYTTILGFQTLAEMGF